MGSVTRYDDQAAKGKVILVYPDASDGVWKAGSSDAAIDVTFIGRLLDRLTTEFQIDKTRIFVAGASLGAMMAYRLACQMSDRIAAIASVSGALLVSDCSPARPVSVLEMHGTDDAIVPYAGNSTFPSTASTIQRWVTLNGCAGSPTQTKSGITMTSLWIGCRGGTAVRLDTITGGQHTWFTSDSAQVGQGNAGSQAVAGEPDATQGTWDFLINSPRRS